MAKISDDKLGRSSSGKGGEDDIHSRHHLPESPYNESIDRFLREFGAAHAKLPPKLEGQVAEEILYFWNPLVVESASRLLGLGATVKEYQFPTRGNFIKTGENTFASLHFFSDPDDETRFILPDLTAVNGRGRMAEVDRWGGEFINTAAAKAPVCIVRIFRSEPGGFVSMEVSPRFTGEALAQLIENFVNAESVEATHSSYISAAIGDELLKGMRVYVSESVRSRTDTTETISDGAIESFRRKRSWQRSAIRSINDEVDRICNELVTAGFAVPRERVGIDMDSAMQYTYKVPALPEDVFAWQTDFVAPRQMSYTLGFGKFGELKLATEEAAPI